MAPSSLLGQPLQQLNLLEASEDARCGHDQLCVGRRLNSGNDVCQDFPRGVLSLL